MQLTKRSPTQRHMHNYSLPSPSFASRITTLQSNRCQSSPAWSEFRKAIYIPHTILETVVIPVKDGYPTVHNHTGIAGQYRCAARAVEGGGTSNALHAASLRAATSDPGISLLTNMNDGRSTSVSPASFLSSFSGSQHFSPSPPSFTASPVAPTTPPPRRPCTSPSQRTPDGPKLKRLSADSIPSLPFPLPTPSPGLTSNFEWEVDPFASTSYPSTRTHLSQSKWSPESSTHSLHRSSSPSTSPKKDQSAFGRLKRDIPSPTKLKEFFGRLSVSRSPTALGSHLRSASATKHEMQAHKARQDSLMPIGIVDEKTEDVPIPPIEMSTQNDGGDIPGTLTRPRISYIFHVRQRELSSAPTDSALPLDDGDRTGNGDQSCTVTSPISSQASIAKYTDVDSSISASIQIPLAVESPHATSSHTPNMRVAVPDVPATPSSVYCHVKRHPDTSHTLAIPPSPCIRPPNPPNSPPPAYKSLSEILDLGFPSPPKLVQYSSCTLPSGAETSMERSIVPPSPSTRRLPQLPTSQMSHVVDIGSGVPITRPPAIPPRSRLRPPPVKITTNFRELRQMDYKHRSRSSSLESLTISPLSPPPHSRSSSTASFAVSPMPTPPQHSHSASVASSLMISPMPTPPPLSPTSPSSIPGSTFPPRALASVRRITPEPQLDMDVLRTLILRRSDRSPSACESDEDSEFGETLEAIALAHMNSGDLDDWSASTVTNVELFQEEPRPPPSRLSLYEESNHPVVEEEEEQDDAASLYSQFSVYRFRSRSSRSTRGRRSFRRKRMTRRATRTSMMSIYSQASFTSEDAMDLLPVPTLPWGLEGEVDDDVQESLAEDDLGEMTFNAPEYAYAYSLDDYVGHGLEGVALAGRTACRSGMDFEAQLPLTPRHKSAVSTSNDACPSDDWRNLIAPDKGKGKRRTSSNISVAGNVFGPDLERVSSALLSTDDGSLATDGSIGDISATSTLTPTFPVALIPNRRQRTIRRVATSLPSSPCSNCQPPSSTSVNFVFDTDSGWRRDISSGGDTSFPSVRAVDKIKKARGVRTGFGGMKSRVSILKSRLVSLTQAPRSPSSLNLASGRPAEFHEPPVLNLCLSPYPPISPSATPSSVSPGGSSSPSSSGSASAEASTPSSASLWTPGLTSGDGLFLSPIAAPAAFSMAI